MGPVDVPPCSHCPGDLLGLRTQGPARPPRLLCQSQLGQVLQAAKQERTVPASTQVPRDAVQIDPAITRCHRQSTLHTGPAILHGLALPPTLDPAPRARPAPARRPLRCAGPHNPAAFVTDDTPVRAPAV